MNAMPAVSRRSPDTKPVAMVCYTEIVLVLKTSPYAMRASVMALVSDWDCTLGTCVDLSDMLSR